MTSNHLSRVVAPLDALLLKGDADPATRAIMSSALLLNHAPDFERLIEAFERASRSVPRMREKVINSSWSLGQPQWVTDDHFDVLDHVRQVGAPRDRSLEAVLAMASTTATAAFDPARPLWDASLITGLADEKAVLFLRVHHAVADGVRAIHMMAHLLDLEPAPSKAELPVLEQRGSSLRRVSTRLARTTSQAVLAQQLRARDAARASLRSTLRPITSTSSAATYVRSAMRAFGTGGATPSPLLQSRSRARKFDTLEFPLEDMRSCAKAGSATVNDVFLAGLLGGMRKYHEAFGAPIDDTPLSFPIDVSGAEAPESGNHFSAAVIPGPSAEPDPTARLKAVHELVTSRRAEPGVDAAVRLAPVLHQLPSWIATAAISAYSRRLDLQASNIVGPDCPVYLAGTRVHRFHAFGPLPGVPAMAVLVSYEGICTIGFTIDPAAITDPELFVRLTREAFEELLSQPSG